MNLIFFIAIPIVPVCGGRLARRPYMMSKNEAVGKTQPAFCPARPSVWPGIPGAPAL
jgi:hypothetical protein